jgi:iron complex outermembrane receptor protein
MFRTTLGAVLALALLHSPIASTAADEVSVVVTGSRFSGSIARAIGATVITAEDIAQSTATTLGEVLDRLGGVIVRRSLTGTDDPNLDLRGFGVTGNQNTLVLVDGQRLSENELAGARISSIPLAAIERIEILRGAGAVLHGSGASGGVINIVTRGATADAPRGYVAALGGSLRTGELRGGVNLAPGKFGLSLHASQRDTDNWRRNNATHTTAASGEARLGLDQGFVALRFAADRQDARLPGARTEAQLGSDPRGTATPKDFADSDADRIALAFEKKLGEWRLAADLSTRNKDAKSEFNDVAGAGTYMRNATHGDERAFSPRLLWQRKFGAASNALTLGGDWRDTRYRNDGSTDFGFGAATTKARSTQDSKAYYLQDQVSFPTATSLSLGARRERIRQDWQELVTPLPQRTLERSLSAWELAVRQHLGGGFAVHARSGKSFRVANVDENACFFAPCTPLLEPQTSRETGIGAEWGDGRNRLRAEWFDMRVDNEIYYNNLSFANMNMPPLRRRGLQLDAAWRPLDGVELVAHYTGTDARFVQGTFGGVDVADKQVPVVPRHRLSAQLGWQFLPSTRVTLAHSYVGEQHYDNDPANRFRLMPSYGITDVKLSHRWRDVFFNAGINNLGDKAYYAYALTNGSIAPTTFNAYPDARRTAYLSAEVRF